MKLTGVKTAHCDNTDTASAISTRTHHINDVCNVFFSFLRTILHTLSFAYIHIFGSILWEHANDLVEKLQCPQNSAKKVYIALRCGPVISYVAAFGLNHLTFAVLSSWRCYSCSLYEMQSTFYNANKSVDHFICVSAKQKEYCVNAKHFWCLMYIFLVRFFWCCFLVFGLCIFFSARPLAKQN